MGFDLGAQYSDSGKKICDYKIQLAEQPEKKKIKIEARMSIHGIFSVENAHIVETEEYEEVTKEKREIKEEVADEAAKDGDEPMPDAGEGAKDGEKPAAEEGS